MYQHHDSGGGVTRTEPEVEFTDLVPAYRHRGHEVFNGIGHIRSTQTGKQISGAAGNRVPDSPCLDAQGVWGPISNKG